MPYFRVIATGTHRAAVDIEAASAEDAAAQARAIDLEYYHVVEVHPGQAVIEAIEPISADEARLDDDDDDEDPPFWADDPSP